ncbi:dihydrodipicolinate synthase family protein [Ahrensia marina]|uniref:dihydrodipicolinate synthase family protein n=1 Tax=Ahrensia marina TaxID=1514904 RepID=UPI0035CF29F7
MIEGLVPVMVTPMREDGSIDSDGIHSLVEFLIAKRSGGLWVLGSAGEDLNIGFEEKVAVARETVAAAKGRIPLLIGTGLASIRDNLAFFDRVADVKIDGLHIIPLDVKMSDARLVHLILTLADRAPHPLWLYHNPKRGKAISDVVIKAVRDHANVAGIKVGGYNLVEMMRALALQDDGFQVIGAGGAQMYAMLVLGAKAHTTSEGSCLPELFTDLHDTFVSGDWSTARAKQYAIMAFSQGLPRTDNGEYAAEEKYVLHLRGICDEFVNPLYRLLTDDEKARLRSALDALPIALDEPIPRVAS